MTDDLRAASERAAIFGFPLVENFKAFWAGLSPHSPQAGPANRLAVSTRLYGPDDRVAVSPNNDTLYAGSVLDLRAEPVVVELPDVPEGRYYSLQFIDAFTDNPAMLGSRTTGHGRGRFVLTPPGWSGALPPDTIEVTMPSVLAMTTCRTQVNGAQDVDASADVARAVRLLPLHEALGTPDPGTPTQVAWPAYYDAKQGDAPTFFTILAWMLQWQRLDAEHDAELTVLRDVFGIVPGNAFDPLQFDDGAWSTIADGLAAARAAIAAATEQLGQVDGCWRWSPLDIGHFGTDYLGRSAVAWKYIYAADAGEAVYPMATVDSSGRPLDGSAASYTIHFPADELPPARFFWSITMYGDDGFMVNNAIDRYSFGDRTASARRDPDGGLTVTLSADVPVAGPDNWLPAPRGPFYVLLRIYGPGSRVLDGSYRLPPIDATAI